MIALAGVLLLACGDDGDPTAGTTTTVSTTSVVRSTTVPPTTVPPTTVPATTLPSTTLPPTTVPVPVVIDETSFVNINDMTAVRGFFVDNLLGDLDATLAVAENLEGGIYPAGSVVQLFPGEAMVKREAGFSPETNDWEFFELIASPEGTTINVRGGAEAVNQFGGSCADCHSFAEPQFDFICEQTNGCEPLPIGRDLIELAQAGDPRPRVEG
ncbi:MAG: hypothetical protein DHS20C19_28560 [Acidimicrobiales bacterium]|nr:MAG: hypothetical protein DHS20C19_28560 [Acidimicrobiales bacterium]